MSHQPANSMPHVWLRAESKPSEERTALTPEGARRLVAAGFRVTVEDATQCVFSANQYRNAGCEIAAAGSWQTVAPREAFILGLKELADEAAPLTHRHIYFAHVYKNQFGWQNVLHRFVEGGGTLYDLEFLVDEGGRRVAAFGRWAGFAGAALAMLAWAGQQAGRDPVLDPVSSRPSRQDLLREVAAAIRATGRQPRALVIGALGRSGCGAVELCQTSGADIVAWDLEETKRGGPFLETLKVDVLVNCVLVNSAVPPFLTTELLQSPERRLSVICDVSCDPYGDYNPLPIYSECTTFQQPTRRLIEGDQPLDLIAIDHLPSLLPRESSESFCEQLMPHLLRLNDLQNGVWKRAYDLFRQKTQLAKQEF